MTKIIWHNVGNPPHAVMVRQTKRILVTEDPDFLFLCEAADRLEECREIDRDMANYDLVFDASVPGGARIKAFVHKRVNRTKHEAIPLSDKTRVERTVAGARRDGTAEAKAMLAIWYEVNGIKRIATGLHLVPSASRPSNKRARALHLLQTARVIAWMIARVRVVHTGGDWNMTPDSWLARGLRLVAKILASKQGTHGDRIIDFAAVLRTDLLRRGAKATRVYALDWLASDHDAVVVVLAD